MENTGKRIGGYDHYAGVNCQGGWCLDEKLFFTDFMSDEELSDVIKGVKGFRFDSGNLYFESSCNTVVIKELQIVFKSCTSLSQWEVGHQFSNEKEMVEYCNQRWVQPKKLSSGWVCYFT